MDKNDLKIVFMGTPEFAVASLQALVEKGYRVVGVVTMPDKPVGRHGSVLQASAVKQYAVSQGIPVLQPAKLKDEVFVNHLRSLGADLQIVVAFRMLPELVWNMPRFGTFNLHASLLPQYRGAAPINWAVINGEKETGVTTFFLAHEIDTGHIIRQERMPINETDNVGNLHDKLMTTGAQLVIETVDLLIANNGNIKTTPQNTLYTSDTELRDAPKIFKDTCRIDWNTSVQQVYNFIRGLSPYPGAWSEFIGQNGNRSTIKIFDTEKIMENHSLPVGTLRSDGKKYLDIAVTNGFIRLKKVQLSGKKRMPISDFLNGIQLSYTKME